MVILNILLFLLVLSIVICIHELGHFVFAKKAKILCHEFSFGMGPKLWSRKKGETTFSIRAIPFGGFVAMAGEEVEAELIKIGQKVRLGLDTDGQVKRIVLNSNNPAYDDFIEITVEKIDLKGESGDDLYINDYIVKRDAFYVFDKRVIQIAPYDRLFGSKIKWQRFLVAFAGPMMNFVLAIFVFLLMFMIGGVADDKSTVISEVSPGSPAAEIILPGDKIISINGVLVSSWAIDDNKPSVRSELAKYDNAEPFIFVVERNQIEITLDPIYPQYYFISLNFASLPGTEELLIYIASADEDKTELRTGDRIISIDGETFENWNDLIAFQKAYVTGSTKDDPTVLVYERDGELREYKFMAYGEDVLSSQGYELFVSRIGIVGSSKFSLLGSLKGALSSFASSSISIYKTLGLLFSSKQIGVSDLSGFIGIYTITSTAASQGLLTLLNWIGFLSVNLGIINLLPIPALDGGRIVFIAYEAITKKKPNQKFENALHMIVFFLLMGLLIFITYNDILRLFGLS
ncbi:MAG: RIP metalloprotease RseP [Candidatus Izemoplasmatales bacterium]|jgi:regulator of sigma E protease